MLYKLNNITISLGGSEILSHIDFEIHGTEKIAITGRNGAGKTTLLKFIAGELEADRDDRREGSAVELARSLDIGMLRQTSEEDSARSIEELCLGSTRDISSDADTDKNVGSEDYSVPAEWEFDRLFTGFGFAKEDKVKKLNEFSGGEQTKIRMIRLLLTKPDILLLDEPTNHLDMKAVEWFEEYLKSYEKAVVFVTHDRFFMDKVADVVYEIENRKAIRYPGNYTHFRQEKQKRYEQAIKAWERYEKERKRLEELIRKYKNKSNKAAFARSRQSILNRMEKVEKPHMDSARIFTGEIIPQNIGAKWVVDAEHLKCGYKSHHENDTGCEAAGECQDRPVSYEGKDLGEDRSVVELSFKLRRGSKVAIVGDNGSGKSTFLKTVAGHLKPLDGKCTIGNRVEIGYFDQMSASINSEQTVYEHFAKSFPGMLEKDVRKTLGQYLFSGVNAQKMISSLSGGEKARLVLAEILTSAPNFLILDEPTNHMDIEACEAIESALMAYKGTVLFVSHDRYLVGRLAESFYIFEDGKALYYPFDYEHYLERLERLVTARRINVKTGIPEMERSSAGDIRSEIMGLVSAEDAAMIEGLKAVPKTERHEIGKTVEEANDEWRLRLAKEELEAAQKRVDEAGDFDEYEEALNALSEVEEAYYLIWSESDEV